MNVIIILQEYKMNKCLNKQHEVTDVYITRVRYDSWCSSYSTYSKSSSLLLLPIVNSFSMLVETSLELDEGTFAFIHKGTLAGAGFSIASPYTRLFAKIFVFAVLQRLSNFARKLFNTCERQEKLWRTKPSPSSSSSDIISGVMCRHRLSSTDFFFKALARLSNSYSDMIKEHYSQTGL